MAGIQEEGVIAGGTPTNEYLLDGIDRFQRYAEWHHLTCGNDKCRADLEGKEVDGKVVLVCPQCDYRQEIPDHLMFHMETLGQLEKSHPELFSKENNNG